MARFIKGINGAYSGKVGNVVGSNWRSIDYVRSVPKRSKKPASVKQLEHRAKFGLIISFIAPIKDIVNIGLSDSNLRKYTGFNLAVKMLLNAAVVGDYPDIRIDYSKVQLSKGPLAELAQLSCEETAPQVISIGWLSVLNRFNSFLDDEVVIIMYDLADKVFSIFEDVTRADEGYTIEMPQNAAGHTMAAWVFVIHRDGIQTSNSQYLGEIVLR